MEPRRAYFINELVRAEDGGFIPCIAEEGTSGYWKTDWNWGSDRAVAEQIADEKNAAMGLTPEDVWDVVLSSMRRAE